MKIEQIYTGCLAQGAYYIESNGEAAIIDPLREVKPYIEKVNKDGAKIKYIFETHFHADFVSGHVTLAKQTGANIIFGPNANPSFDAIIAKDNEVFQLGEITITALHTPGHTMESTTYLLKDKDGKDRAIFTGDTLFLGDVGRPDLAQKAASMTQEDLAGLLYDSLRNKIMPLSDEITVYPAHGAGSACGKNMMKETVDTLGNQKKVNYALRADMTKEEFVEEVTDGLMPPPQYFPTNVRMNKEGYEDIDDVLARGTQALSPDAFEAAANETGAVILDVRHEHEFAKGHIPKSIFIGLDGDFAPWVGALIADVEQPILLVTPKGKEEEAVTRLSRVGFDNALGYLKGSFDAWKEAQKEYDTLSSISPKEFAEKIKEDIKVIDVRKPSEYQAERIEDAENIPLDFLNERLAELPKDNTFYMHCAGGYRSVIASSILKARGMHNMINVEEGFDVLKTMDAIPTTDQVCPTTLK
jgi:glyoxylase-like metal-dependent hydrolase (beta-lactamase superfamily II)/rhodanese-related sulfurtransferase